MTALVNIRVDGHLHLLVKILSCFHEGIFFACEKVKKTKKLKNGMIAHDNSR